MARGAYLAAVAGCDQCHTDSKNGGAPYAGGRVMDTEFGAIATPNITPDVATGIGGWSADAFMRAMRWGIAPDGTPYVPAFPFPYFAHLGDGDLADLKAFLDTVKPVSQADIAGAPSLALFERARAALGAAIAANFAASARVAGGRRNGRARRLSHRDGRPLRRLPYAADLARSSRCRPLSGRVAWRLRGQERAEHHAGRKDGHRFVERGRHCLAAQGRRHAGRRFCRRSDGRNRAQYGAPHRAGSPRDRRIPQNSAR